MRKTVIAVVALFVSWAAMAQLVFQVSWTFGKQGNYGAKKVRRSIENEQQLNATSTSESMNSMMPIQ